MDRYYLKMEPGREFEVTKAEYVRAERSAGFHNTLGQPAEPATASFGNGSVSGRTHFQRPVYLADAQRDGDDFWAIRITGTAYGGDLSAVGWVTQAKTRQGIERMARDLIRTVLDLDGKAPFDVYVKVDNARNR